MSIYPFTRNNILGSYLFLKYGCFVVIFICFLMISCVMLESYATKMLRSFETFKIYCFQEPGVSQGSDTSKGRAQTSNYMQLKKNGLGTFLVLP